MKPLRLILAVAAVPGLALAQRPPLQEQGAPPLQRQMLSSPPGYQQPGGYAPTYQPGAPSYQPAYPPGYASPPTAAQPPAQPAEPSPQATPQPAEPPPKAEPVNTWVPAGAAKIQALDKVTAQAQTLTVKVGQSAQFESLTITVKSCVVRPPTEPQDAAAYVDVTDSHPDQEGFDGWLLANEPAVSMMQNPIYDLRVTGCA